MQRCSRRFWLAVTGTALAGGLAGCSDQESEFLVTKTRIIHHDGDHRFDYPEDILIRVTVENSYDRRQEGTLELVLTYQPPGAESPEDTWTLEDDISLGQGSSMLDYYVFEDVYEPGTDIDHYHLEGSV